MSVVDAEVSSVPAVFVPKPITFDIAADRIALLAEDYGKLTIADVSDTKGYKAVHEARMHCREQRIGVDNRRKELKREALDYGNAVEAMAKPLMKALETIEERLEREEDRIDEEKARIKAAKEEAAKAATQLRVDVLLAVGDVIPFALAGALEPEAYAERLAASTAAHADKLAREAAEEAERQRLIEVAKQERAAELAKMEAQRLENERLAAGLKAQQEQLAAEQRVIEERNNAAAALLAAERKKLDDAKAAEEKRIADAAAAKEREAEAARIKKQAEIDAKLKLEKEAAAKLDREKKAEAKRLRIEAARPDQEKITSFADRLAEMELPKLNDEEAMALLKTIWADAVQSVRDVVTGFDWEGQE